MLLAKGLLSGNGDPLPHLNAPAHRQAIEGIRLLSVLGINDYKALAPVFSPTLPSPLEWRVTSQAGVVEGLLNDRLDVKWKLYKLNSDPTVELIQVILIAEDNIIIQNGTTWGQYIGFGFAESIMNGLIATCSTYPEESCKQWRGQGTNILPLIDEKLSTNAGWTLSISSRIGQTRTQYSLVGRSGDVLGGRNRLFASKSRARAIVSIGRSTPDSGNPLMHNVLDRTELFFEEQNSSPVSDPTTTVGIVTQPSSGACKVSIFAHCGMK